MHTIFKPITMTTTTTKTNTTANKSFLAHLFYKKGGKGF